MRRASLVVLSAVAMVLVLPAPHAAGTATGSGASSGAGSDGSGGGRPSPRAITVEAVRLVGGTSPHNGYLEIQSSGRWGYLTFYFSGDLRSRALLALVACRQLGFAGAVPNPVGGQALSLPFAYAPAAGSPPAELDWEVDCSGAERSLSDCRISGGGGGAGPLPVAAGGGGDPAYLLCTPPDGYAMSDVRLVNSSYPTIQSAIVRSRGGAAAASRATAAGSRGNGESGRDTTGGGISVLPESVPAEAARGRVDVWVDGMWGAVSSAGFGRNEAVVACRSLGFADSEQRAGVFSLEVPNPVYKNDRLRFATAEPTWVRRLSCTGREARLGDCQVSWCDLSCAEGAGGGAAGVRCV
ncbi:hypothetical protein GPECTOR_41g621 [Gonium pectorale]|uniref:SRCR domain-containing protein n=1 Tax=Gonium pectorale TaxID=33097 RepID=A0A150G9Y3_GONPE|nr:hypothetical protein GPECTOR_41g621 [Gonium pectorale]|eukprot:KXZ46657.1 hypothetical protein GPECTOR_41g621 [Gonium pectorale]